MSPFDSAEAHAFTATVYDGVPGWFGLSWTARGDGQFRNEAFPTADAAVSRAEELDPTASNIYLRTTTLRAQPSTGRGESSDAAWLPGFWADIDFGTVGHAPPTGDLPLPPDAAAALSVVASAGLVPPTLVVHSGGGLYPWWLFTEPVELTDANRAEWVDRSADWQRQLQAGAEALGYHYGSGVGDLARVLRLPGSVNRKTPEDRPCRVLSQDGPRYSPEALSEALEDGQLVVERRPGPAAASRLSQDERDELDFRDATDPGPFVTLADRIGIAGVLLAAGWTECGCGRRDDAACFTRPGGGSTTGHSAHVLTAEPHVLVVFSEDAGLPTGGGQRLTAGRIFAHLHHGGDESAAAHDVLAALRGAGSAAARALGLTVDVFDATPTLRHIRQAAHAQLLGSLALLEYVLARVLAELPPHVMLPGVVAGPAALNLGVAVVGNSGAGKSGLLAVSRMVLGEVGLQQEKALERNIGSGEGMAATFLTETMEIGENGKPRKARDKVLISDPRRILLADEVDQLDAISNRNASTFGPTLRSAITGQALGQENASDERRRHVPGGSYRLVLLVGVQPSRSGALLKDASAGTPQRLVWVEAGDPNLPDDDVPWPGALDWDMPQPLPDEIDYPDHLKAQVRAARRAQVKDGADALEGHKLLTRAKLGAALALLHGEVFITDQWWGLAGVLIDESMRVQAECARVLAADASKNNEARAKATGQARVIEGATVEAETAKRKRVADNVLARVADAGSEGINSSEVRKSIRASNRGVYDQVLPLLIDTGQVRASTTDYQGQKGLRLFPVE